MAVVSTLIPPKISLGMADLPPELMDSIASYLSPSDLISLRSTNNYNYHSTTSQFAQQLLGTIKTDLSADSFQKLGAISRDVRYVPHIKALRFARKSPKNVGNGISWPRVEPFGQINLSISAVSSFVGVVQRLVNCQSFEFHQPQGPMRTHQNDLVIGDAVYIVLQTLVYLNRPIDSLVINLQCPRWEDSKVNLRALCQIPGGFNLFTFTQTLRKLSFNFEICCPHLIDNIIEILKWSFKLDILTLVVQNGRFSAELLRKIIDRGWIFKLKEITLVGPAHMAYWSTPVAAGALSRFLAWQSETLERITLKNIQLEKIEEWEDIVQSFGARYPHLQQIYLSRLSGRNDNETERVNFRVSDWKSFLQRGSIRFYRDHGWEKTKLRTGGGIKANGISYEGPEFGALCESIETLYTEDSGW
ncbi:hypothetical protein BDV06DRAFT_222231 [Aspergillus oleicola]